MSGLGEMAYLWMVAICLGFVGCDSQRAEGRRHHRCTFELASIMIGIASLLDDHQSGITEATPDRVSEMIDAWLARAYPSERFDMTDPWGNAYNIEFGEEGIRVWSSGPNGKDERGGGDDVIRGDGVVPYP